MDYESYTPHYRSPGSPHMPRFLRRLLTPAPCAIFSAAWLADLRLYGSGVKTSLVSAAVVQLMAGCATGGPPPPPPETTVEIVVPVTTPLPETTELQQKGGKGVSI